MSKWNHTRILSIIAVAAIVQFAMVPVAEAAAREPRPIKLDHRVRTVMYQPDEVYKFIGHYGFQSVIEFSPDEEINTISMGDATGWMLNPVGNRLFLKPVEQDATTNMTLITDKNTYLMELHAREAYTIDDDEMVFILRFIYPGTESTTIVSDFSDAAPVAEALDNPNEFNTSYTVSGPELLAPIRIFDDGEFTYFEFKDLNADLPAFFLVDSNNEESVINFRMRDNFVIVERVGERFTLRYGKTIVCVFNEDITKSRTLAMKKQLTESSY